MSRDSIRHSLIGTGDFHRKMATCIGFLYALILLTLSCLVNTVDRNNFKTCEQSAFCRRNRNMEAGKTPYFVQMNSVKVTPKRVEAHLVHATSGIVLKLELRALAGGMIWLRIDELTPLKPRFEPMDAFVTKPKEDNLKVTKQDSAGLTAEVGQNKVVLTASPFRLDVYSGQELVISANSRGLLRFEHYRLKAEPKPPEEEEPKDQAQPQNDEEKEDGYWDETFKSHTDSKPYGPSSIGLDFSFVGFEHLYGIPEHAESFALKQTKGIMDPYRLYNLDVFEYELYTPMALYGSVPYMIAHSASHTVGLLWLNAAETWVDIESPDNKGVVSSILGFVKGNKEIPHRDTHWISESGVLSVIFMPGPGPKDLMRQYARLTGTTPLPPLFAVSYHQCRWNYNDQEDVRNVDAGFDEHDIPYDVIWLDVDHTDNRKYFTWEPNKFPTPEIMLNNLTAKGRKMVTLIDPHIKRDGSYYIHSEAQSKGLYVKNKNGDEFEGWCWPGSSSYLDFFNPETRDWWAGKFNLDEYKGSTLSLFTWNDMNEPSVFNGPEVTMDKDCKHFGDWEHRDVHNIYGFYLPMSTFKGHLLRSNGQHRPFVLSRAFFAGSQRFGAVWTGDNTAEWSHLKISIPMMLTLGITGLGFSGADVGGFFRNPDAELILRWYQAGAFQPFFRAHAHIDSKRREPWLFDEETKTRIRDAIRYRYVLLPYWYTLFFEMEQDGIPPMRPLWMEFPADSKTFTIDDTYLVGSALLVRPIVDSSASSVTVYLPGKNEVWYDFQTHQKYDGQHDLTIPVTLDRIPVFQRGGTIIPRKERIRRCSSLSHDDPYTLSVSLDKQGIRANGSLYIDDGYSMHYRNGDHILLELKYDKGTLNSKILFGPGHFQSKAWLERVLILGLQTSPKYIHITSKSVGKQELGFQYHKQQQALVIRRPGVNILEEWAIQLS